MKYLIIGNCAAGVNAVEGIREIDNKGEITLISDENYPAYCRCLITNYVIGTHKEKDILLTEDNFYKKNKVDLLLGKKVKQVDTKKSTVVLDKGKIVGAIILGDKRGVTSIKRLMDQEREISKHKNVILNDNFDYKKIGA